MRASRRFSTSRGIYPSGVNFFASDMVKPFATLLSFGILQAFHSVNYMLRVRYFTGFPFGIFRTRKHLQGRCFARQAESPAMPATRSRTVIPDGGIRAFKRRQVKASTTAATMPTDAEGNAGEISHAPATFRPMPRARGGERHPMRQSHPRQITLRPQSVRLMTKRRQPATLRYHRLIRSIWKGTDGAVVHCRGRCLLAGKSCAYAQT